MKIRNQHLFRALLLSAAALILPQAVMAAGTPACTPITNIASVSYTVSGAPLSQTSPSADFTVGNKIIFSVQNQDAAGGKQVVAGSTNQTLNFRITNTGNANQRFLLTLTNGAGSNPAELSGVTVSGTTDNFNTTNPGVNAISTNSFMTPAIIPGAYYDVTINADIPSGRSVGDGAAYALIAQAYKVDGLTPEAENASASITSIAGSCSAAIVFADTTAGAAGTGDAARDGKASDLGIFKIVAFSHAFNKNATTIWDPINGSGGSARAIPGALIQYAITVTNNALSGFSSTLTTISDTLNSNLAIDPDLKVAGAAGTLAALLNESAPGAGIKVTCSGAGNTRACANIATPQYFTTATYYTIATRKLDAVMATLLPIEGTYGAGELKPGESVTVTFNAVVQ